ncbi:MAG TPA: argininosuccinate synthase [Candidatus Syntrophoarchaeum butanivorans]|uniref:Argininosuccinate synthase n=1 Tax=Candidatus Syntropharchaeum butanivorans TaxID=1839936 RepID=A0A1F2P419_9EURY|nr:MAG: argininosuccinate synthase [Candidatus Syntrophoarchaeum butanivorans]RJS70967.1 MAG: argininosuccinate synthase [Candidatus Syntrophoarchaeum sp. WYZ-LMO15]HEC57028.1 argininosuccinate synthase [Candidatus Syntrophoarchaeum butanivorans]
MKVALAYSGGLDTSVCIPLLKERYGVDEVISVVVDLGQPEEDLEMANMRGEKLSDLHVLIDAKEEFVRDYIFPLIKANGDYEGYVLGTAIARPLIAKKVGEVALKEGADAVAHGCTGKGNDQLRFDAVFRAMGLKVIAPMRELGLKRSEEIEYAKKKGVEIPVNKETPWSIDENLWSRSIEGGMLEDPSYIPPEEIFKWTKSPEYAPDTPAILRITFNKGVPVALDGKPLDGPELIRSLNRIAGEHGVGRSDIIEDRVLGLKARENYEHPAATVLLISHRDLEQLTLTRNELKFKALVDATWAELVYQGLILDPLYDDLTAFIDKTQERVSGEVMVRLYKGTAQVVGRSSEFALYRKEWVSFDTADEINPMDAEGFSKFHGLQARLYRMLGG